MLRPLLLAACLAPLSAQEAIPSRVRSFVAANCANCHGARTPAANLDLSRLTSDAPVWTKVLDRLTAGTMPPAGLPKPKPDDVAAVRQWIMRDQSAARVTAHRLNRAEYDNTVRDLLGVDVHAASEFPLDDAGYGFDNIADVLSVSPLLAEKYLAAARKISQIAIYGAPAPAKPEKLVRFMTKKSQDDPTPRALTFANRGALEGSFYFPVTGTYELRMRVGNYRPRTNGTPRQKELIAKKSLTPAEQSEFLELSRLAYPPVKMIVTFDGAPVLEEMVEGNIDYQYAHGESIARVRATAGEHRFRASFPAFADLDNPLDNMNLDGRRKLFIDYLDVVGPFEPPAPSKASSIFVCAEKTAACADRIIDTLARRAFRHRAVDPKPLQKLAAMVRDSGDGFEESIRVAVQAMLVSPNFLFRFDDDLASKLSYFLWSSMPDDELFAAAPRLGEPAVLEAQVKRMLAHPKAQALVDNFAGQWLGLRQLDKRKPDPKVFPRVDDELLEAMRQETLLFTAAIVQEDRSVFDFLDGRFSYVNGPLARHYGIEGVSGEAFQRVDFKPGTRRAGVVTHASVLTQSSYATRTSPVLRGRWVLENLLGTPPPPAPPDVPALEESQLGTAASLRQRLEQHRAKPACAVCHDQMDPIGFSLENYDATGAWRERDGQFPIDASGPAQLQKMLAAKREAFLGNFTEKLLTYALGRGVEPSDRPALERIQQEAASSNYRFSALVLSIVKSSAFQGDSRHAP